MTEHILVADNEKRSSSFVERGLRANGFEVTIIPDGPAAYLAATTGDYALMLLDIGLPLLNGNAVLTKLRQQGHDLPVIILTARSTISDAVASLALGADDYVVKPFRFDELLARVKLRLRTASLAATPGSLRHGELALDPSSQRAVVAGLEVALSAREYSLLEAMMRRPGQVFTREQLLSLVWGYDFDPGSNVVDVYIRYLRRKIGASRIETLRGVGYRLAC